MCTLSWTTHKGTRHVFFNRDERKTRGRAVPPRLLGKDIVAPIDSDAGGTWLAVNTSGLCVALLNRWHDRPLDIASPQSRGEITLMLAGAGTLEAATEVAQTHPWSAYQPFTVIALDATGEQRWDWDGAQLSACAPEAPITSSSYKFHTVRAARRERYDALADISPESLAAYHCPSADPTAHTVRMNRPDAQTWSRSHIVIGSKDIDFTYDEEFLDLATPATRHKLRVPRG